MRLVTFIVLVTISTSTVAEYVHWTAKVKWVTVKDNDSVWVGLEAPYSPNPATATWSCGNNIVWLGAKDMPAPNNMLSTALTLYATKKSVRVGIEDNNGIACEANYLSARE